MATSEGYTTVTINRVDAAVVRFHAPDNMKLLLIILLTPLLSFAQFKERTAIVVAGLIAGVADGQREVIVHNPHAYRYRHPKANEAWWNPDSTWRKADRYAGPLVFVADKYHLNQFIRQSMFVGQTTIVAVITVGDYKRKGKILWGKLLVNVALSQGSYMLAKGLTHRFYDVF